MTDRKSDFVTWPWHHWADRQPKAIALSMGDEQFSWQELSCKIDAYAVGLAGQGVRRDQIVAAVSANNLELIWLQLVCLRLGAALVVINPRHTLPELQEKLTTVAAHHLWFAESPDAEPLGDHWHAIRLVLPESMPVAIKMPTAINRLDTEWQPTRLASLVFTSGSTGLAKAVAHSAGNHLASAAGLLARLPFTAQDSWLLSLPLYHVSGLAIVWRWLYAGARLALAEGRDLTAELSRVSHASLVPTQLHRVLNQWEFETKYPLFKQRFRLKQVLLGGAVIPVELTERARKAGIHCWVGYGMTEAASTVTAKPADATSGVGLVLPRRRLQLKDGQIMVQGDTLCLGYYQAGTLIPVTDSGGWFATKDLGNVADGELFILGRIDNMFISGGENIHPEEIERALLSHPHIRQAVVFSVPEPEFGQRPVAVIDCELPLATEKINQYLHGKLAKFKWPDCYYPLPANLPGNGVKLARSSVQRWLMDHIT